MAIWIQKILLTVMAALPVIAGEIFRLTDGAGIVSSASPAVASPHRPGDCPLTELRWRTLEPPSALAGPATLASVPGAPHRGC